MLVLKITLNQHPLISFFTTKNTHFQNTVPVSSGLSDLHKLVLTVLKTSFDKNIPCEILYRGYKNLKSECSSEDLQNILSTTQINSCKQSKYLFVSVLNIHAPLKKELLRTNHSQYVTKALIKAIMRRSKLEKIYFEKQTNESLKTYKKQKNYCRKLYKKERKKFFDNPSTSVVSDNKTFWEVIKPFLTNKSAFGRNI